MTNDQLVVQETVPGTFVGARVNDVDVVLQQEIFHCSGCSEDYDTKFELDSHQCPKDIDDTDEIVDVAPDEDAILEALVVKASVPNLAALYQRGKEAGLIKPVQEYGTN